MTTARFRVGEVRVLEERHLLALTGEILQGMPRIGMVARSGNEGDADFREEVHGVEFLEDSEGRVGPALTFEYRGTEELERWRAQEWEGRVLLLER